mmetsp:Transcript_16757/g.29361  ORF Transcript_16757/g.29361 Transcript_16757/m.29361 type:complete len:85 (-) Transcript_16757:37-291(-)
MDCANLTVRAKVSQTWLEIQLYDARNLSRPTRYTVAKWANLPKQPATAMAHHTTGHDDFPGALLQSIDYGSEIYTKMQAAQNEL